MSPQECRVETKITDVQGQSRAPEDIVKDDSGAYAVFTEQRSSASWWLPQKKWMLLQDYQVVTDKQLMHYLLTLQ